MKKIGLGIIGLGYIGNIHLGNSLRLANARLLAVSDISKKARDRASSFGVKKVYANYEDLLKDSEIDAVIIGLPTHLHLQCSRLAAEAEKHIFLEKPIATGVEEAKEIVSVARQNSVKLMIGYPLRFNPPFSELKVKMKSGVLGDIVIAYARYISSGPFFHRAEGYAPTAVPEWWFRKELTGGGALIDVGCHMVNLLRWYFGEVTYIQSYLEHRFNMDLEDSATCLAKFESGTTGLISVGWFSQDFQLKVEFFGTVSSAIGQVPARNPLLTASEVLTMGTSRIFRPYLAELQHFVDCVIRDLSPSPSGEDGLRDLETISLAYRNQMRLE